MTKRTPDHLITTALRDVDPAPKRDLSEAERGRAEATFARIVATPIDGPVSVDLSRGRRRRSRFLVPAGLIAVAGVAVPAVLLGGGSAYASWTATPEPLENPGPAAATCRNALAAPDKGERVAVAERRGDWTFVLLTGDNSEAVCLMPDDAEGSGVPGEDGFFGSYDPDTGPPPVPAAQGLEQSGAMSSSTDEGWFTWVAGYVGRDVTGVTVRTPEGLNVEATLAGNRFAAWWPGDGESWLYVAHLADGSTQQIDPAP